MRSYATHYLSWDEWYELSLLMDFDPYSCVDISEDRGMGNTEDWILIGEPPEREE